MPFIVTTKRPDRDDRNCDCHIPELEGAGQHSPGCACFKSRVRSCVAVATLEARDVPCPFCGVATDAVCIDGSFTMPLGASHEARKRLAESGGTVTFRDERTVEVEPTTNAALYEALDARTRILLVCDEDTDEVVAAWNARKAGTE